MRSVHASLPFAIPITRYRISPGSLSKSSVSKPKKSLKTSLANSKLTPCFPRFLRALPSSHSNSIPLILYGLPVVRSSSGRSSRVRPIRGKAAATQPCIIIVHHRRASSSIVYHTFLRPPALLRKLPHNSGTPLACRVFLRFAIITMLGTPPRRQSIGCYGTQFRRENDPK